MGKLIPSGRERILATRQHEILDALSEFRICRQLSKFGLGSGVQHEGRISRRISQLSIEPAPNVVGRMIPRDAQFQGELAQILDALQLGR